jgi:hypothetical protein
MLALLVVAALLVPTNQTEPELAARIHHLIDVAFSDDDAARDAADVRKIFRERGLPTTPIVGSEAAEEFIVLSAHEQAPEFTRAVLAAAERAQGAIPPHAVAFLRARIKQKAIETSLRPPYPNAGLTARLNTLYTTDQGVRKSDRFDAAQMIETDARTGQDVRAIFNEFGVPPRSAVGPEAAHQFVVMVQHQPADLRRIVLPKLRENVDRGEADPADYAMMFDRSQVDDGKLQHYGANFACQPDGTLGPSPIDDVEHLDARRAEIGLLPMRLYSRLLLRSMPPDFCKKVTSPKTP